MTGFPRCSQCGAPGYAQHPVLGWGCWWHCALLERFRGERGSVNTGLLVALALNAVLWLLIVALIVAVTR